MPGQPPPGAPRRDPYGFGVPGMPPGAPQQRPGAPMPQYARGPGPAAAPAADGGEAVLREALSRASREVIEKIAWEVVPQLAEVMIREELERLIKERQSQH